ncbi:MAG: bifunctional nicotinamide-nucleotide adenylyltransferase/Nudix hydroxylase [Campylobacteraceae bacterium]|jgi:bifunctional NMN adenylyltransferase/nudix hydrolase|nr:bifunctional nicotinamide-nucleotide adenylyltransferase/Nudix hydroxylase [Campylobacteraceae bacterium]
MNATLSIYIGRFQPLHNGHLHVLEHAQKIGDTLVLIGSAKEARNIKNPFPMALVREMLKPYATFIEEISDYPFDDSPWLAEIQEKVSKYDYKYDKVYIIGHDKDESSYYLKSFPQWTLKNIDNYKKINATTIREELYKGNIPKNILSLHVEKIIKDFMQTKEWQNRIEEYQNHLKMKEAWSKAPYEPIFVTTDCVTVCNGHILLVIRGGNPGKGLYALPGGFLDGKLTIQESAIKELREETRIKLSKAVLIGSIKKSEVFDKPDRSTRGRTITHAFLLQLGGVELPAVKGGDDAKKAFWIPLSKVKENRFMMFEDHFHIIRKLTNI